MSHLKNSRAELLSQEVDEVDIQEVDIQEVETEINRRTKYRSNWKPEAKSSQRAHAGAHSLDPDQQEADKAGRISLQLGEARRFQDFAFEMCF